MYTPKNIDLSFGKFLFVCGQIIGIHWELIETCHPLIADLNNIKLLIFFTIYLAVKNNVKTTS